MNVKELRARLRHFEDDRQIVLHRWDGEESSFVSLNFSATPRANTKNLCVMIVDEITQIVPLMDKKV